MDSLRKLILEYKEKRDLFVLERLADNLINLPITCHGCGARLRLVHGSCEYCRKPYVFYRGEPLRPRGCHATQAGQ